MAFNFPSTAGQPIDGTFMHTVGDVRYIWDGSTWKSSSAIVGGSATVASIDDLTDVDTSSIAPAIGEFLEWNGTNWVPGTATAVGVIDDLTDVDTTSVVPVIGEVLKWDGTNWVPGTDSSASYQHATVAGFPNAATSRSSLAYAIDTGSLYYSDGTSWTNNRLVTTTSTLTSDLASLIAGFETTYTLTTLDHSAGNINENAKRKIVRLADSQGVHQEFVLAVQGNTISIDKSVNTWGKDEITIKGQEYWLSVFADAAPADSVLRLSGVDHVSYMDVKIRGLDGILVERIDGMTLGIRAPSQTVTQYTDDMAKDAAAYMLLNGTHTDVTFTYDSTNRVMNVQATGSGGGGTGTTYDLAGRNTTSGNAFIDLIPSSGTTDSVEFTGSGGTDVSWDGVNNLITINSKNYTVGTPAAANGSGDLALVDDTFTYTPPDLSGYLTSIPIADASTLGGIKVGQNLTITGDGTLSAVQGNYTLPTAGVGPSGILGGVKVDGSTVTIDGNGVISSSGGTTVPSIGDVSATSASIADNARGELSITGHKGYVLYKITTDVDAWVRLYCDDASRQADINRSEGNDPLPGSGVIAEARIDGSQLVTPGVMGFNNDNPRTETIYLSINNRSGTAQAITVTLTVLKIGE